MENQNNQKVKFIFRQVTEEVVNISLNDIYLLLEGQKQGELTEKEKLAVNKRFNKLLTKRKGKLLFNNKVPHKEYCFSDAWDEEICQYFAKMLKINQDERGEDDTSDEE